MGNVTAIGFDINAAAMAASTSDLLLPSGFCA